MTRWLVTGAGGMLGQDLCAALAESPQTASQAVTATTHADLDITDPVAVSAAVSEHDLVLNAAAWTDVDGAEACEEQATTVNGHAVAHLARACAQTGALLVHVSTDYVFSGEATQPYTEDAPPSPINAYGRSKLAGEQAVRRLLPDTGYVVRTAWLYGEHGTNFVTKLLHRAATQDVIDVVDDQRGQPTWTNPLARHIVALARQAHTGRAPAGIYHGTASGQTTWYGLARAAFELAGLNPERIRATTSGRWPTLAKRPAYSVLSHARWATAGMKPLPAWHPMLTHALTRPRLAALVEAAIN